ncbi:MAG: alpha/beta fold hydrolase [Flavobacteriia bacterium]
MGLHFRTLGEGKPLVILHGLFGSGDNWQALAKRFSPFYTVYLVDLRNHGHSPWDNSHTYEDMVEDVYAWVIAQGLKDIHLLGHSMGGKVAMCFAQQYPHLLSKLLVIDMGVKGYPMHHQHILAGIHALHLHELGSRSEAESQLKNHIESQGVIQFLLKNLYWIEKGRLAWRMNVAVLEQFMPEILAAIPEKEAWTPTLFIRGGLSNYILSVDIDEIELRFPDSTLETIEDAGHWVHAEQPDAFADAVLGFCLR